MTTNDIESVQILIRSKEGEILVGGTSDGILIGMIASYVKFVKVDKDKFAEVNIKELLKGRSNEEDNV